MEPSTLYRVDDLDVLRVSGESDERDLLDAVHDVVGGSAGASLIVDLRRVGNLSESTVRELGDSIDAEPGRPTAVVARFEVGSALLAHSSSAVVTETLDDCRRP